MPSRALKRIVLTGGPGAGKTVISARILDYFPNQFTLVPEAATQVYRAIGRRWDEIDLERRNDAQRRIYRHQVQQEADAITADCSRHLLLDRGTIDGAAYWPAGPADYWRELDTSLEAELQRYDAVLWLETAAALGLYDGAASNDTRFEDADAAVASGQALYALWKSHPHLYRVHANHDLSAKVAEVCEIVKTILR